jgi:hypothetical protein
MQRYVSLGTLKQIKELAAQGQDTRLIARQMGLSVSTVHKARQGYYDHRLHRADEPADAHQGRPTVTWCQNCRCHCDGPCKLCAMRRGTKVSAMRPRVPIPPGIGDPRVLNKLQLPLSQIGLSDRTVNRLETRNILNVNDLLHCTRAELLKIPHLGERSLEEIYGALARLGFGRRRAQEPQAQPLGAAGGSA